MKQQSTTRWTRMLGLLAASTILAGGIAVPALADKDFQTTTPIKHVVIVFDENISFDHYFGTYPNAANPAGEPTFAARDDTPSINGLTDALLTNNPNLAQPFRLDRSEAFTCDQDHNYTDEQKAVDGGLMDLFVQATGKNGLGCRSGGITVMGYYDGNTVTALWNYAQRFSMNDNSFGTMFGPSTPGALNLVSGQTGMVTLFTFPGGSAAPTMANSTDTGDIDPYLDDCGADLGGTVPVPKSAPAAITMQSNSKNIGDLLNAKGITWGWFEGGFAPTAPATVDINGNTVSPAICGSKHTLASTTPNPPQIDDNPAPGTDIHATLISDYVPHHEPFMYYVSTRNMHHVRPSSVGKIGFNDFNTVAVGTSGATKMFPVNHQYDFSDFVAALKNGNMPAVSFIKPPAFEDGHPRNSTPLDEQRFLVDLLNMLQRSPEWTETAVFILWDDSDGWYDHMMGPIVNQSVSSQDSLIPFNPVVPVNGVLPVNATSSSQIATSGLCATPGTPGSGAGANPLETRCGHGPRLPFLVISPWAKQNFVDNTLTDQTSPIRFVEENFGLGFVDGQSALAASEPLGGDSFDHIAGSVMNMFDFDDHPNLDPLILDDTTGEVVGHKYD